MTIILSMIRKRVLQKLTRIIIIGIIIRINVTSKIYITNVPI